MTEFAPRTVAEEVAVSVEGLCYAYGDRKVLDGVSFQVEKGDLIGILGPNGSGKTTLFRLLSTLYPAPEGMITLAGCSYPGQAAAARRRMGVVFQSPSLDRKLTVFENLLHQGHLYGLRGGALRKRSMELLRLFGLEERARDLVETLSGGLQRRVEVAKALLHEPELLLMDEPSTGIDPAARRDFWRHLFALKERKRLTILVTTHLLDEAERCDRLLVLDRGKRVAWDTPNRLRALIPGSVLSIRSPKLAEIEDEIKRFWPGRVVRRVDGTLRIEPRAEEAAGDAMRNAADLLQRFAGEVTALTVSQPSLEDVFLHLTGHHFDGRNEDFDGTKED
ncbi:ABC-type multidrug transport system, ATPase component [Methylacidimicrobium sp. AP8]|uniref:ABC transporter ATP-binding protein n=1 Tax=Methylacidimicrobium sp. AP8 TaxID=2730359 RepID=UPI0018C0597E|nr:ABC transporter ATP-binding protein [Methylacidimicrobium sp. AP8]CAB4244437.1 ABC-type multidrug transport system, ATPase component [Methylacidimicrobium sp. AP8]